jgi:hypothetical protein
MPAVDEHTINNAKFPEKNVLAEYLIVDRVLGAMAMPKRDNTQQQPVTRDCDETEDGRDKSVYHTTRLVADDLWLRDAVRSSSDALRSYGAGTTLLRGLEQQDSMPVPAKAPDWRLSLPPFSPVAAVDSS